VKHSGLLFRSTLYEHKVGQLMERSVFFREFVVTHKRARSFAI